MSGASKLMSKLTPRLIPDWLAHYPKEKLGADIGAMAIILPTAITDGAFAAPAA